MVLWIIVTKSKGNWWFWGGKPLVVHYIDDFFGGAPIGADFSSEDQYNSVLEWFVKLGIPTKESKCKRPATRRRILGFLYDTILGMVFIPRDKELRILIEIDEMLARKTVTKQQILSLVGKLRWAAVCIYAGPAFVRRMEEAAHSVTRLSYFVPVNWFRTDLVWWKEQISSAALGVKFEDLLRDRARGDIHVLTDASTHIGMGGWNKSGNWFRFNWKDYPDKTVFCDPKIPDIYWKEMAAIATACLIWGQSWEGKAVTFWCDNIACVFSMIKRRCDFMRKDVMALIRIIANCANNWNFRPYFLHISGKDNLTADALSRFDMEMFKEDIKGIDMDRDETECKVALDLILAQCFPQ